ncbi:MULTISPECIES: helix-turn-helix transcriptional regulator [unclassified Streptomyces]|uniref:helix-turn-helix transcriptional regulator n=1 Tax=unclassified Streptomyces TaxID=2593676 RepID=UPI002DD94FA0|nr:MULTISPECIES: helix-turn-helix transcriptional regulator [unclassified Streptomyces]WSC49126.1 helix-turn-helix transcriptional regulator [Streptomyces sp. NBC_01762]WSD28788.1 helix-turn-helix transcriptional regulator [Streptomyces sp. NBC_01751]WSF82718.1 helix-turn-helix transcriptional regulator [Streptomyces sp. NBC_01744]
MPDAAEASLLTFLGLEPLEDAVYRLLVDRPDCEPATLAGESTGCAEDVARALDVLVERGLASARPEGDDDVIHYRAASPVLALGPLLESRRASLRRVESLVTTLAERHRSAQAHASGAPVEVLSGAAAIRRRLLLMQDQATIEVCTMMPLREVHSVITVEDNHDAIEDVLMRRGIALRSVIERDWLERPEMAATAAAYAAQGQHISVVDELPIKLIIVDRRMALLPLAPERDDVDPVALAVHGTGLLTALSSLFEAHFERGWRLLPSETDPRTGRTDGAELDAVDRQIVSLLYVGLTDAAIARQLGMGHRTVQRRLQSLMVEVGAATRFQLGWRAARSGWLDGADAQNLTNRSEDSAI